MTQATLFEDPTRVRRARKPSPAREVGEAASVACAEKAERVSEFDREAARAWVLNHLRRYGPTPGESLTDGMKLAGIRPHDDRAFGQVYASLSNEKLIVKCGSCDRRKGHGTAGGRIWRLASAALKP